MGTQLIEYCFNQGKAHVDKGSNSKCSPQRFLAVCLDKKVVSKTHSFDEVERRAEILPRESHLPSDAFRPYVRPDMLDEETRALRLNSVVGTGDASW